jgi:D-glycero-D-manno-heptose 1,7-bisphosphate phosphatase
MDKLLLLDKDGTLVHPTHGKFVDAPWHQAPIPGVAAALDRYQAEGWKLCIISNQGGVAAGHKSLDSCILEMRYCLELFPQIREAFFCPDFEGKDCWRVWGDCKEPHRILYGDGWTMSGDKLAPFRKPEPGMLQLAMDIHSPGQTLYIGDRPEDEAAAAAAGVPFDFAADFF